MSVVFKIRDDFAVCKQLRPRFRHVIASYILGANRSTMGVKRLVGANRPGENDQGETSRGWERSGSVVECLTQDRRAVGSSLTGVTALWSLSKTHLS